MMKLLLVDDNEEILELLQTLLESGGYNITTSTNGKDSLNLILNEDFDVILLDITMPDFSGLDVVQSLMDSGDLEKNYIILFTAASISDEEIEKWLKTGVKDCLRKPFDPSVLFDAIVKASL